MISSSTIQGIIGRHAQHHQKVRLWPHMDYMVTPQSKWIWINTHRIYQENWQLERDVEPLIDRRRIGNMILTWTIRLCKYLASEFPEYSYPANRWWYKRGVHFYKKYQG